MLWNAALPLAEGGSSDVKVAIVTTIGVIVAAGFTALATTLQRDKSSANPSPVPTPGPTQAETLVQQYIHGLEHERDTKSRELDDLRVVYSKLRDACWEKGLDPDDLIKGQ